MISEAVLKSYRGKVLLVTGGTGSFGQALVKKLLPTEIGEIRIFSRDEKKQDDMRKIYGSSKLTFYIGDVRDKSAVKSAMRGVNYVFQAAALKQVPSCEFYPIEAVKTNILGTDNVLTSAIEEGVSRVVCLSTDKAVYPINAMGMSKALMEKVMAAASRNLDDEQTRICATRYGNVMASRGSVIPLFMDQIRAKTPITITNPEMTRFMMSLDEAVELVLYAFEHGRNGDIFVRKAPAATIDVLASAIAEFMDVPNHPVQIIGSRHGEKLYESLLTREEKALAIEEDLYFRIPPDTRDLNYAKYFEKGEIKISDALRSDEYTSHNTTRLDHKQMVQMLHMLNLQ